MERLLELTRSEMMKDVEVKVKKRAASLKPAKYLGITRDYIVNMSVDSSTGSGYYIVKIKLIEYPDLVDIKDMTTKEKVRLSLAGDMAISCNCPAFNYWGYKYIVTQLDAHTGIGQDIYPKIRNPRLEGVMCKHTYRAFKSFGSYWARIASDIDKKHFITGGI